MVKQHLISAGIETVDDVSLSKHQGQHASHNEYVITLLVEGEYKIQQQEVLSITSGMVMLIPKGVPHKIVSGNNMTIWWLSFCSHCLELDEQQSIMQPFANIRQGHSSCLALSKSSERFVRSLFKQVMRCNENQNEDSFLVLKSLLTLLLNEIKQSISINPQKTIQTDSPVSRALTFIEQNSLSTISLKDVADFVNLSPNYLATQVKKATGFSVGQWITQNKLSQACTMLSHGNQSIEAIGEKIGWSDTTHFIRQFKKNYGVTPAQWRKRDI